MNNHDVDHGPEIFSVRSPPRQRPWMLLGQGRFIHSKASLKTKSVIVAQGPEIFPEEGWRDGLIEAGAPGAKREPDRAKPPLVVSSAEAFSRADHPACASASLGAATPLSNQQGEIVKSDKSPSQIRNFEIADWDRLSEVQSEISDLGFEMQDSSDFKISSHRCLVSQVC